MVCFKNRDETEEQEKIKNSINAVCKACGEMSDKKIGSLIVFERETKLGEISKTGTTLFLLVWKSFLTFALCKKKLIY